MVFSSLQEKSKTVSTARWSVPLYGIDRPFKVPSFNLLDDEYTIGINMYIMGRFVSNKAAMTFTDLGPSA